MTTDNTTHAAACCLDRWVCTANGSGKTRDQMPIPCGFEQCATVETCPKAQRLRGMSR